MTEPTLTLTLPAFEPALEGFRAEEFLTLTESLLAFPVRQDSATLAAAPFRLERPEPRPEPPLPPLPPRWYPRPAEAVIEAARAALVPPPRPPIFEGRAGDLARVLRPLLAGHPVQVRGECGVGKTTLLAHIASHERTRQRFRRIWWIDQPARLEQSLALVFNLPHVLAEPDPERRRSWLAGHLDEHTLLIVDNLLPDDPHLELLARLTEHVLTAVETEPEVPIPDEPLPPDPEGVVTLRTLDPTAASDALAAFAGLQDIRRTRAQLVRIATALGHYPYALMLAGALVRRDGLTLDELEEALALESTASAAGEVTAAAVGEVAAAEGAAPDATAGEEDESAPLTRPSLNRALDVSVAALPRDYRRLFEAFAAFPLSGAPFDGLCEVARLRDPLAARRGLIMLEQYGFVQRDHRDPSRYVMHAVAHVRAHECLTPAEAEKTARAMRQWAARYVRQYEQDPLALYRAEPVLCAALEAAEQAGPPHLVEALEAVLSAYRREYIPGAGARDAAVPAPVEGPRREAANLTAYGLELTDGAAYYAAEEALKRALALRLEHDSPHAIAETEVALGRLYDVQGRYAEALDLLVRAAERVYQLGAPESLSVIRRGLARVYRHLDRLNDALGVLDEAPEAHYERAVILRAQGNYAAAVAEMARAGHGTPYDRAEVLLLAGRPADALEAIQDAQEPESVQLRAQAYHLQGRIEEAIAEYRTALAQVEAGDLSDPVVQRARARILRGLGAALGIAALQGEVPFDEARSALEAALALLEESPSPDRAQLGAVQRLLAAVHLAAGDAPAAIQAAQAALDALHNSPDRLALADTYRTLGRALWQQQEYAAALVAFEGEAEHAQSVSDRDEARIGVALHHVADAYRATGEPERAIANYRLALSHKNPSADPHGVLMTQLALLAVLRETGRLPQALDVAQEIVDLLARQPDVDLQQYGLAQVLRARVQIASQRPIRARQSLAEWTRLLAARASEAAYDPRPGVRVLALGLAVRSLLAEDRPALALPLAEYAAALTAQHFPDSLPAWAATRDLGEVYLALGRPDDAALTLEPLLAVPAGDDPVLAAGVAHACALIGQSYRELDDPANALEYLRRAVDREPEQHLRGLLLEQIAAIYLQTGQPAQAVEALRAALAVVDREEHPDVGARLLTTLAHTLGGLNRYADAIGVYEEALAALRDVEGVSPAHTADVLRSLGQTHEAQGQLGDAARAYRRALNLLERHPDAAPHQQRDILHQLARVTAAQGDGSAVALYEQLTELVRAWGDSRELGLVLCELADVHRESGRFPLAVQQYQAALEHQPVPPFARERLNTLRNLGRAYAQMQRYDEARAAWTEALALSTELPDSSPAEIGLTHFAIAEAFRSQGHYADAVRAYQEALQHHPTGSAARAASLRALGQTLIAAGRPRDAVEPLRRALETERAQPQQANARLVLTLQMLAQAHEKASELDAAIARHHEALVYMDRTLQPVAYADTLRTLGRLYRDRARFADAHTAYKEALEIESAHVPRSEERISATLQAIADTYRAQGDLEKAAEYYQKVTVYANLARRASEDLRATLDELERRRGALQAAQQSLALLDRSDRASIRDLAFVHALIAHAHARLNQPDESAAAIRILLTVLDARQDDLPTDAADGDIRALGWLVAAYRAERQNDTATAEFACGAALESVSNADVRWVIEQVNRALNRSAQE